jgi:hypothetical protein
MSIEDPQVIIRLGSHAEKEYLDKTLRFFDGLILGANLVEATPGATSSLLVKFGGPKNDQPYFIDPMTYAFGAYTDEMGKLREDLGWIKSDQKRNGRIVKDFKRSYRALATALGETFESSISRKRAINPDDFKNASKKRDCCRAVANYQIQRIADEFCSDSELTQFADKAPRPSAIYAPYFYCETKQAGRWLDLVVDLASTTVSLKLPSPVHAVICVDQSFLSDPAFLKRIKSEIPDSGVTGVWLWFSRFYEDKAEIKELEAFRSLVESLNKSVKVYNMHGGYFSLALSRFGMSGISHGVGYGEQKDVLPVIGQSAPTVRYYLPGTYKKFGVPDIELCFNQLGISTPNDFHKKICNCVICKGVVRSSLSEYSAFGEMHYSREESLKRTQTPSAAKRSRFHFLLTRIREREELKNQSSSDIVASLEKSQQIWGSQRSLKKDLQHLRYWKDALS